MTTFLAVMALASVSHSKAALSAPATITVTPGESIQGAVNRAKSLISGGQPAGIVLGPGRHEINQTLIIGPGTDGLTIKGTGATVTDLKRISGWQSKDGAWVATLPEVKSGTWKFMTLYVQGERRYRSRLPAAGTELVAENAVPTPENAEKGHDRMKIRPGTFNREWLAQDVEVITLNKWTMGRFRPKSLSQSGDELTFTGTTFTKEEYGSLGKGTRWYAENVPQGQPGTWRLDRNKGELTYWPKPGETPGSTRIEAPRLDQLLKVEGDYSKPLADVSLSGITFEGGSWQVPPQGRHWAQAESDLGASIEVRHARGFSITDCTIAKTSAYGIMFETNVQNSRVSKSRLIDLGAGGVKVGLMGLVRDQGVLTKSNIVEDSVIYGGGRLHAGAIGVWVGISPNTIIRRNWVEDFYYSAFSVGWSWGYGETATQNTQILDNTATKLGQNLLSDMGGIYTLGLSPGSVIRGNRFSNIRCYEYGGWGIYNDEGSSGWLIEENLTYDTASSGYHQHYGRDNLIRNNVFAYGSIGQVQRTRPEDHVSFTFEGNIVALKQGDVLIDAWNDGFGGYKSGPMVFRKNLYRGENGAKVTFTGLSLSEWQKKGMDEGSVIADPMFVSPSTGDFRLQPESPAPRLIGFRSFSALSPRPRPANLPTLAPAYPLPSNPPLWFPPNMRKS